MDGLTHPLIEYRDEKTHLEICKLEKRISKIWRKKRLEKNITPVCPTNEGSDGWTATPLSKDVRTH